MSKSNEGRLVSFAAGGILGLSLLGLISLLDAEARPAPLSNTFSTSDLVQIEAVSSRSEERRPSSPATTPARDLAELDQETAADAVEQAVLDAVQATWPEDAKRATQIVLCESRAGLDPKAWNVSHPDGGPMQINRATWAEYFYEQYGWSWEQLVFDLDINLAAAREIYDRTGGWHRWSCADVVLTSPHVS